MTEQKGFRYLYVEDDLLSREVMVTLLEDVVGVAALVVFANSFDFMARLRALPAPPDFIFLDIHIHPHDGYDLLNFVRADPAYARTRVLAVTASVMSFEVAQLRAAGFDGALTKPVDILTFPDLVRRLEAGESIWQIE